MNNPKGILVTGSPRSGTSWVGRMLSLAPHTRHLYEPFNHRFTVEHFNEKPFPYWFLYVNEENQHLYIEQISRMIDIDPSKQPPEMPASIPIIKDPIAVFSSEWLANYFDLQVVFLLRHPAAFVKSILTLDWNPSSEPFIKQDLLVSTLLPEYREELEKYQGSNNKLGQAAFMWRIIYYVATIYQERNPNWIFKRHEDLSSDAPSELESLYSRLGLEYTNDVAKEISAHSSEKNPVVPKNHWDIRRNSQEAVHAWHGYFTTEQLSEIRHIVEPISSSFYMDNEWP